MTFSQLLGRQRRTEIGIMLANQSNRMIAHSVGQAVVRRLAAPPVRNRCCAAITVALQQPMRLSRRQLHQIGRRRSRQTASIKPNQNLNPIQLSLAHQHYTHRIPSLQTPTGQRLTFQLCSVLTF